MTDDLLRAPGWRGDDPMSEASRKTVHLVMSDGSFSCPSKVYLGDRGTLAMERVTCWACLNWWLCW